jgi:hypothetical protein
MSKRPRNIKLVAAKAGRGASKASHKSHKGRRPKASAARTIGVVHTTSFTSYMQASFEAGLQTKYSGTTNISYPGAPTGGYGPNVNGLQTQAGNFITQNVDLILAAGGLSAGVGAVAAYSAHRSASNIPFVFIAGETSGLTSNNNVGGVNLNSIAQNSNGVSALNTKTNGAANVNNIVLIVNSNASMSGDEINSWTGAKIIKLNQNNVANSWSAFLQQVQQQAGVLANAQGVLVSSDPYFYEYRSSLKEAIRDQNGGNFQGYICWPFAIPTNDSNSILCPTEAVLASATPQTNDAYYQAGIKAGEALTNAAAANPLQSVGVVTWQYDQTSMTWVWA